MELSRLLRGFGPLTIGGGGATPPNAPVMTLADRGDGTGADATISGSTVGATNSVYYANLTAGVITWQLAGTRSGNGLVGIELVPGSYLFEARSSKDGMTTTGTELYATLTGSDDGAIYDRADSAGINVVVEGTDPAATNTVQYQDTATGVWIDGPTRTGDGLVVLPISETGGNFDRTYGVRVKTVLGLTTGYGTPKLTIPTKGYASDAFLVMQLLTKALISANIDRIGGRVFRVIDPRPLKAIPDFPCIFVFQALPERVIGRDNEKTQYEYPITVRICEALDGDWATSLEWWLYARQRVMDLLSRVAIAKFGTTATGRRWQVEPGGLMADGDPEAYQYRGQDIIIRAECERPIGGI